METEISPAPKTLMECFAEIDDPRLDRKKRHELIDILVIDICAVICGAEHWRTSPMR